jgi:hypothetical protein
VRPGTLIGDLNDSEIHLDPGDSSEQRLFLLAHLFSQPVQWNVDPRSFELGQQYQPLVDKNDVPAIIDYEPEAASYALDMLHRTGITDIDRWFSELNLGEGTQHKGPVN